jgi:hypothetical protein
MESYIYLVSDERYNEQKKKEVLMIHVQTTNLSALKLYAVLRDFIYEENGVEKHLKNPGFFLELKDPTLADVNPFDEENLTNEQKGRIIQECATNFWYFIREVVRIPSSGLFRFEFHRGNLAMLWAMHNNYDSYVVLPRQCFKTYTSAADLLYILYFSGYNTEIMTYSSTDANLKNNMGRIRAIRDHLPKYLQMKDSKVDRDSSDGLSFKKLGNTIMKRAPGRSVEEANNIGRGFSTPIQYYDEFPFIVNIQHQYPAAVFGYAEVAKKAAKSGNPHFRLITTTAGYLSTDEGRYAYKFLSNSASFTEILYDKTREEVFDYLRFNGLSIEANRGHRDETGEQLLSNRFLRIEYMWYDLFKSDEYYDEQCDLVDGDQDIIDREILNKWKDVTTNHPLGQELVSLLENCIHEPRHTIVINDVYFLKLYRGIDDIEWDLPILISSDCAGNVGKDFSTVVLLDPRNFEVIGTLRCNAYSTAAFGNAILYIMNSLFPKSTLIMERNSMGIAVLDHMIDKDYLIRMRIYQDPDNDAPGFNNDKNTRPLLYNTLLRTTVQEDYNKIHDRNIIGEVRTLVKTRSGRIDHQEGAHDDTLMALLIGRWFFTYGKMIERYIPQHLIGVTFSSKEEEVKYMKETQNKEREDLLSTLYGKEGSASAKQGSYLARKWNSDLLAMKEHQDRLMSGKGNTMETTFDRIDRYLEEERFKNIDQPVKILGEEETVDEEKDYEKDPKDIKYKTTNLSDVQELERKIQAQDFKTFKDSLKRGIF